MTGPAARSTAGVGGNAGYWYRRAGKPVAKSSVEEEWEAITTALLAA